MTQAIAPGYPVFLDANGAPLDNGYVFIGTSGSDAVANPINTYWDSALSVAATQPIRTTGGYLNNNGTPGNIFVSPSNYSVTVKDKNGVLVYANTTSPAPVDTQAGNIDSESATNGYVLTANGSGGATWVAAPTGTTNLSVTTYATTVDVESDTGTNGTIPAATTSKAGVLTSTDKTKLDGIEALADVTDATNVDAAGATMNTDTDVSSNSWVVDEDNMVSDLATKVPTQQSVKAYVDAQSVVDGTKGLIETLSSSSGAPDAIAIRSNRILKLDVYWGTGSGSTQWGSCVIDTSDDSYVSTGGALIGSSKSGTITGSFVEILSYTTGVGILAKINGTNYEFYENTALTDVDILYYWL